LPLPVQFVQSYKGGHSLFDLSLFNSLKSTYYGDIKKKISINKVDVNAFVPLTGKVMGAGLTMTRMVSEVYQPYVDMPCTVIDRLNALKPV